MRLQPLTRAKVASLGDEGAAWTERLPDLVAALEQRWSVTVLGPLPGGSESYVARARTVDGADRVVKLGIPRNDLTAEAAVLAAARGRGYAVLHAHDVAANALLLELLGTSLHRLGWSPERTLGVLADTLAEAWRVPLATAAEVTAGVDDKATLLHRMVVELWERLDRPCPARRGRPGAALRRPPRSRVRPGPVRRRARGPAPRQHAAGDRAARRAPARASSSSTPTASAATRRTTSASSCATGSTGSSPPVGGASSRATARSSPGAPVSRRRTSGSGATWSACRPGSTCWASEPSGSAEAFLESAERLVG